MTTPDPDPEREVGAPEPTVPDYGGRWVGAVLPALSGQGPPTILPEPALGARVVVLLVLDGLGWSLLDRRAADLPTLASLEGGPITTVAPSTTAAALTSITTGAPPSQHGVTGFRFRVGGQVLNALQWRLDRGGSPPDPTAVQPLAPFGGAAVPVVSRAEFERTGFTTAHLRGAPLHGWRTQGTIATHCAALLASGHTLVYTYYDGIDKVAHAHGLEGAFLTDELRSADRLVADLLALLPADGALVVVSDHGQVQVGPEGQRSLASLDAMIDQYSGEGRFRSLHARTGAAADLLAGARELAGQQAWVRSRDEIVDAGWLGPGLPATVAGRLGDVVIAPHAPVAFADPSYQVEQRLQSMHGSLTAEEMLVPLLAGSPR